MAFFDELKDKAMDLGRAGVAKSRQLAEIAKLYYAERGMAPEAAYVALCEKITASKVTIEENKNRIAELKAEGSLEDTEVPPVYTNIPPEEPGCSGDDSDGTL